MSATKVHVLFLICFIIVFLVSLCQAASTKKNRRIAEENYKDSVFEKIVATHLGDELPKMRDDLIRRKNNGEGFVERHIKAWSTGDNWHWHSNGWNDDK